MTFADKIRNIYCLTRAEYNKILDDSITATYKNASSIKKKKKKKKRWNISDVTMGEIRLCRGM